MSNTEIATELVVAWATVEALRKNQRRRDIAEAVFAVIGSRGFDAVSLREVATQAGVSMGSVRHYFTSKDEMLVFTLGHMRGLSELGGNR